MSCNIKSYQKCRRGWKQTGLQSGDQDARESGHVAGHLTVKFAIKDAGPDALLQAFANRRGSQDNSGDPTYPRSITGSDLLLKRLKRMIYAAAGLELLFVCAIS
jgi:hypothetical protein